MTEKNNKEKNRKFIDSIHNMFSLRHDMASYDEIENTILSGSRLQGTNMCILMLAILIASIGLNMNSTAVIIGAMLISPLMGGITAIAYGFATNDLLLSRFSALRLLIQVVISISTSAVYFAISPITTASSELIARTKPTAWDVLIAICGGFAGIIGQTRKEKSNVIPGVAIATALMPPLCTAGYGLAHFQWSYFFGALYLFFINGFFICITAIIVLKYLKVPTYKQLSNKALKKIHRSIATVAIITMIPSIYLGYDIVSNSLETSNADSFLKNEFNFKETQMLSNNVNIDKNTISVSLIGKHLDDAQINKLNDRLKAYSLKNYKLDITQTDVKKGVSESDVEKMLKKQGEEMTDQEKVAEVILEKENEELKEKNDKLQSEIEKYKEQKIDIDQITSEATVINSSVKGLVIGNADIKIENNKTRQATSVTFLVSKKLSSQDMKKLKKWITKRLNVSSVIVMQKNVSDISKNN